MRNYTYIIAGASGLIGREVISNFISSNKDFFIIERDVDGFFKNLNNHYSLKKEPRQFVIINCAFDSKKMDNNFNFINEIVNSCKKENFKIIHWIQLSSISAYQKISDYKNNFLLFINNNDTYLDNYASTKIKIDRLIYKYLQDQLIKKATFIIPTLVTGGLWDLVLSSSNMRYIPKNKKKSTISSESLGRLLYEISLINFGKSANFIIPKHLTGKWNSLKSVNNNFISYKVLEFLYKKYLNIFIKNRLIQIICAILFKFTKLHIFFIYKYIHSIEIVNSFDLNDKAFKYD
ncbi:MAG: hypothetical protein JXQ86_04180 [Methylophilaceae bacterium]